MQLLYNIFVTQQGQRDREAGRQGGREAGRQGGSDLGSLGDIKVAIRRKANIILCL